MGKDVVSRDKWNTKSQVWLEMFILIHSTSIYVEVGGAVMNKAGSMSFIPECKHLTFIIVAEEASGRRENGDM